MSATSRAEVSNRNAIIAAILYLATFLALFYGVVALIRGERFIEALLFAFPSALLGCALFYVCAIAREAWQTNAKPHLKPTRRPAIDSLNA